MPQWLEIALLGIVYVSSGGAIFAEWGKQHKILTFLSIVVAIVMTVYFWKDRIMDFIGLEFKSKVEDQAIVKKPPELILPPAQPVPVAPKDETIAPRVAEAPKGTLPKRTLAEQNAALESVFPLDTALTIRSLFKANFTMSNWVSWGANNISVDVWVNENGRLSGPSNNHFNYLGSGDSVNLEAKVSESMGSKVAMCVYYEVKSHHIEVAHVFGRSDGPNFRELTKPVSEIDGPRKLCSSMPAPVAANIGN